MYMEGAHQTCQPPKSCSSEYEFSQQTDIYLHTIPRSSLPKLQTLKIRDCLELKHIIREKDGENNYHSVNVEKEMVLPNLQELSLK